ADQRHGNIVTILQDEPFGAEDGEGQEEVGLDRGDSAIERLASDQRLKELEAGETISRPAAGRRNVGEDRDEPEALRANDGCGTGESEISNLVAPPSEFPREREGGEVVPFLHIKKESNVRHTSRPRAGQIVRGSSDGPD